MGGEPAWKKFERSSAKFFGGERFPANMGGPLDFEGPIVAGQCKNVKELSFHRLETLAIQAHLDAEKLDGQKVGVVVTKRRAGTGHKTPALITFTKDAFELYRKLYAQQLLRGETGCELQSLKP